MSARLVVPRVDRRRCPRAFGRGYVQNAHLLVYSLHRTTVAALQRCSSLSIAMFGLLSPVPEKDGIRKILFLQVSVLYQPKSTKFICANIATTTLTLIAKGNQFDFYINQQFVTQVQGAILPDGNIGVIAGDNLDATEVVYTNAKIWDLDS